MGTPIQSIIESEDRQLFATKVQEIGEQVAPSKIVKNIEEAVAAGKELGYPVCNIIYLCVEQNIFQAKGSLTVLSVQLPWSVIVGTFYWSVICDSFDISCVASW